MSATLLMPALFSLAMSAVAGQAGGPWTSMIPDKGLGGWSAQGRRSACVDNRSATFTVSECAGWIRTDKTIFGDYAIAFEIRSRKPGTRALLGLLGISDRTDRPEMVMAVPLLGPAVAPASSPSRVELLPISETARAQATTTEGEWQSYTVTRDERGVHVLLNGTQLLSSGRVNASDGWIGFTAETGSFELRNLRLRDVTPPSAAGRGSPVPPGTAAPNGAYRPGAGVTIPKLVREVKPNYTREALAARIEGAVTVECVVGPDGTVSEAVVIRSLDDRFGLDAEALKAARGWRFQPGTRNGVPVPVLITIELTFSMKK